MKKSTLIIILVIILVLLGGGLFCLYEFTDVFRSRLIPKAEQVTLNYAPGYDYEEALKKNKETEFIKLQSLKLKKDEIKSFKKAIKGIKEVSVKKKEFDTIGEFVIDKNTSLVVGEKNSKLIKNKKTKYIKNTVLLNNLINNLIKKNNDKILEQFDYEKATIKKDGAIINITNENNNKLIKNALPYYKINQTDDYVTYDGGYQELLIVNDSINIYLYTKNIGYVKAEEAYYVIFPYDLEKTVSSIYNVSIA